jgi:hypothetical protein
MKRGRQAGLDFEIDKLTNSIENVITGDSFQTEVSILLREDLKKLPKKMAGFSTGKKNLTLHQRNYTSSPL